MTLKDGKKVQLIKIIEDKVEKIIRKLLYWENDDKRIGIIIRRFHHFIIYSGITCYFMIHTVIPSYFIFLVLYIFWVLVWQNFMFSVKSVVRGLAICSALVRKVKAVLLFLRSKHFP